MEKTYKKERFTLRQLPSGLWEGRDTEHGIIVTFREHQFDATHKITIEATSSALGNIMSAKEVPVYLDELEFWLRHNHYSTLMPSLVEMRETMGQRIRQVRLVKGQTLEEVARRAGLMPSNVSRIEMGKYSTGLDLFNRIAMAMGMKIDIIDNK